MEGWVHLEPLRIKLPALFSWFAADSIVCFTCEEQVSNWKCLDATVCPEGEKRCITLGVVSGTGKQWNP
uniref:Snake toxin/toxin-like domain-containing protein n=1 Tax=Pseudonaja textilis TaxID=8673 RepID=A0A670ZW22_PSETE